MGQGSGVHKEQTMPLALAWPYTVCVCSVQHVLLSGGYPLEMNRQCVCADAWKVAVGRKLGDFTWIAIITAMQDWAWNQVTHYIISRRYKVSYRCTSVPKISFTVLYSIFPSKQRNFQIVCCPFEILSSAHINLLCGVSRQAYIFWLMHSLSCHLDFSGKFSLFFVWMGATRSSVESCNSPGTDKTCKKSRLMLASFSISWLFSLGSALLDHVVDQKGCSAPLWCAWHLVECVNHTLHSLAGDHAAWLISSVSYWPTCTH